MPPKDENPLGVQRGNYNRHLIGPLIFATGRIISVPIQHFLLTTHPLSVLGISRPPTKGTLTLPFVPPHHATQPAIPSLMLFMTAVLSAKQILWVGYGNEYMTVPFAFFGCIADCIYECVTSLVYSGAAVNPLWSPALVKPATAVHVTAVLAEFGCEMHRLAFKADPKNRGKLCTTGLWGWCRHPNFALNVVYGFAFGFAAGGPVYAAMTGGMYLSNFVLNAIPPKEEYMAKKYGEGWDKYKKQTKWKMFPGIY